jgi:hypothetical protein
MLLKAAILFLSFVQFSKRNMVIVMGLGLWSWLKGQGILIEMKVNAFDAGEHM